MSSYALTDYQHQLLGLGYSFALPPRSDTCTDFLVNLNNLQSYAADIRPELQTLRGLGLSYLQHLESNVTGLPRRFMTALQELKRNDDIICLKADKGNLVVVLDKAFYLSMGEQMLSDTTVYQLLTKDPLKDEQTIFNNKVQVAFSSMGLPQNWRH